ncbi:hypothetical protein QQF64_014650 [Cirrhinus molitorella]|uniref:DUF5641 domain-containing protein n=1 Tax=Cirrhinus molitorella TaxID=172907 RepID=A0ABR3NSQ3_9TELE
MRKLTRMRERDFKIDMGSHSLYNEHSERNSQAGEGLRNFSDFLNSCRDAMPHVKGLEILNDCEENRKLVSKIPDWTAACWNRHATQTLRSKIFQLFKILPISCPLRLRAIHIEMLNDISTNAFINDICCFIAIRGAVHQIRCDQGSNFIGVKNELTKVMEEIDTNCLVMFFAAKQCDFVFKALDSCHTGRFFEGQIRSVRSVLCFTLSQSSGRLNDSSLQTFFYEAMVAVNSRPLTVDNLSDPCSPKPLTPNHLLTLKTIQALPPTGKFVREDIYARKRWRHVQYLAEQFWGCWRKEYVSNIATRQCWPTPRRNKQAGDIVLEKADDLPRNEWHLAEVIETVVDKDGLVRRVKIRFGDRNLRKDGKRLNKP